MLDTTIYKPSEAQLGLWIIIDIMLMSFVIGFILLPYHVLRYLTTSIELRKNTVVLRKGILSKSEMEVPYAKINSVGIHRSLVGRGLGYGDVLISIGNDSTGIAYKGINTPDKLKTDVLHRQGVTL